MSIEDRVRWDKIYRSRTQDTYPAPDPLLLQFMPPAVEGADQRVLDLAGGMGQNGLWLAGQGYHVDIIDISRIALERARAEMIMRNIRSVNLLQQDTDTLDLGRHQYDAIVVFRYRKQNLVQAIRDAVRPGGRLIYDSYNYAYLKKIPGFNMDYLLKPGELTSLFADWRIIHSEESGYNSRLVAIQPG